MNSKRDWHPIRIGGFRSFVEFSNACFLEMSHTKYKYEKRRFTLPSGKQYLPDFETARCFIEIKSKEPTEEEKEKCRELSMIVSKQVGIIDGHWKSFKKYRVYQNGKETEKYFNGKYFVSRTPKNANVLNARYLTLQRQLGSASINNYELIERVLDNDKTLPDYIRKAAKHNRKNDWRDYRTGEKAPRYVRRDANWFKQREQSWRHAK